MRIPTPPRAAWLPAALLATMISPAMADDKDSLSLRLRARVEDKAAPGRFALTERPETWSARETAVIVCDMWDLHHCLNASRRGAELAPTMDRLLTALRDRGATIIHAPSDCMDSYKEHPARKRALETPRAKDLPRDIGTWCYKIPPEEKGTYPIDQTDGGEDDDPAEHAEWQAKLAAMGRNPKLPWKFQTSLLTIDAARDYLTADGNEVWSILESRGIKNVVLMGVHLNMCVLGRPFGLRRMAENGRHVVLMRDMTDTMYNPAMSPRVSHFAGTDLMIEHVEKFVCPSITSDQILGGRPFRFHADRRPTLAFLIAEDEYRTEASLPAFASANLTNDYRVSYVLGDPDDRNHLLGMDALGDADAMVVSVRRRALPKAQLDAIRAFVASGKPVIAIRTASHAFASRPNQSVPEGLTTWDRFDPEVLGGHYAGHHGESKSVSVSPAPGAESHPILRGVDPSKIVGHGSLYKVSPLEKTAAPILIGSIPDQPSEPIAWTNSSLTFGRVFTTSLGQIDDFASPDFTRMLRNAIDWAVGRVR